MSKRPIRERLSRDGVRPSRKLGQNFLADEGVAAWIAEQIRPGLGDCVLEVGPGTGALTRHVAGRVRRLVLLEYDHRLAAALRHEFGEVGGVDVVEADAARWDFRGLFKEGPVKLLGNLPYSSGAAILRRFLARPSPVGEAVFMLQKEFVDRMVAEPRTKAYGAMSVRIQSEWEVERLRDIPPDVFVPRPAVDSSVVRLRPLAAGTYAPFDAGLFNGLVSRGFAQRRKQMHKQMPGGVDRWRDVAGALGVSWMARAEELSPGQWIELARLYDAHPLKDRPQDAGEVLDVVNEADEVTGSGRRDEIHRDGLRHRAVHAFVFNRKGELLLQRRSAAKDNHPGLWDSSAAGHLDSGENYAGAVVRELEEELGIREVGVVRCGVLEASELNGMEHVHLYLARWDGNPDFPCSEVDAVLWMPVEEAGAWLAARPMDFAPGFRMCWEVWRRGGGVVPE